MVKGNRREKNKEKEIFGKKGVVTQVLNTTQFRENENQESWSVGFGRFERAQPGSKGLQVGCSVRKGGLGPGHSNCVKPGSLLRGKGERRACFQRGREGQRKTALWAKRGKCPVEAHCGTNGLFKTGPHTHLGARAKLTLKDASCLCSDSYFCSCPRLSPAVRWLGSLKAWVGYSWKLQCADSLSWDAGRMPARIPSSATTRVLHPAASVSPCCRREYLRPVSSLGLSVLQGLRVELLPVTGWETLVQRPTGFVVMLWCCLEVSRMRAGTRRTGLCDMQEVLSQSKQWVFWRICSWTRGSLLRNVMCRYLLLFTQVQYRPWTQTH